MMPTSHAAPPINCWSRPLQLVADNARPTVPPARVAKFADHLGVECTRQLFASANVYASEREMLAAGYKCYFALRKAIDVYAADRHWAVTAAGLQSEATRLARGLITWQCGMKNEVFEPQ